MKRAVKIITQWNNNDLTSVVFLSCFFSERYEYTLSPLLQKLTPSNAQLTNETQKTITRLRHEHGILKRDEKLL